jgi:hypothetical protein
MNSVFEIILQKLRKRILIYVAMNFVLVVLLILFSEYWLTRGFDVSAVGAEYNNVRNPIASMNYFSKIVAIFSNNYFIALLFIIPALSFLFLIGVMFNTSLFFAYFSVLASSYYQISPYVAAPILVMTPILSPRELFFGFFEFLGYSLTFVQSIYIIVYLVKSLIEGRIKELQYEAYYTVFVIAFSAFILFAAATIESAFVG